MSETKAAYRTQTLLKPQVNSGIMDTELDLVRVELEELERRLIPLLVTVQRALGKEPSVMTPEQRRRMAVERRGDDSSRTDDQAARVSTGYAGLSP